jgi:hypothetical protein
MKEATILFPNLIEKFGAAEISKKVIASPTVVKKKEKISVLDAKRSQMLNIALNRLPKTDQIVASISKVDTNAFPLDTIMELLKTAPTPDEISKVKLMTETEADEAEFVKEYGEADKYIFAVAKVQKSCFHV